MGGGWSRVKNQSCSEWPETHFGFGIFEIRWNFWNFVSGHKQDSISYHAFCSNNFEFGWLSVLVETVFVKKRKKNWKKSLSKNLKKKIGKNFWVLTYVKSNLELSHFWWLWCWGWCSGVKKPKLLRMTWNTFWFWNFWNPMKFLKICVWANNQASKQGSNHTETRVTR